MKNKFLTLIVILLNYFTYAQYDEPRFSSPSANVSKNDAQISDDLYSGRITATVPIISLKDGLINIPLNITYSTNGLTNSKPGWIGSEWCLNQVGYVKRIVKDIPDDYNNPNKALKRKYFSFFNYIFNMAGMSFYNDIFSLPIKGENAGYYFNHDVNNISSWNEESRIKQLSEDYQDARDTEPDIFIFNFDNKTGKFFFNQNGDILVQSDDFVKVELISTPDKFVGLPPNLDCSNSIRHRVFNEWGEYSMLSFRGFTITSLDGTKFYFGGDNSAIEYSIPFFLQYREEWTANTWYLTKIEYKNGQVVNYKYKPDKFVTNLYTYYSNTKTTLKNGDDEMACYMESTSLQVAYRLWINWPGDEDEKSNNRHFPAFSSVWGELIRPTYLESIETTNYKVEFQIQNGPKLLPYEKYHMMKNRYIYNLLYQQKHHIPKMEGTAFEDNWPFLAINSIYEDPYILLSEDRICWMLLQNIKYYSKKNPNDYIKFDFEYTSKNYPYLKTLKKYNKFGELIEPDYKFEYFNPQPFSCYDEARDFWGFYNGHGYNQMQLLYGKRTGNWYTYILDRINSTAYENFRSPTTSNDVASMGLLSKITNPTGGIISFVYEVNNYSKTLNPDRNSLITETDNKIAGGVRIKQIFENETLRAEYIYGQNYSPGCITKDLTSSGILHSVPKLYWETEHVNYSNNNFIKKCKEQIWSISYDKSGENPVVYNEVCKKYPNNSYEVFKYSTFNNPSGANFDIAAIRYNGSENPNNPYTDRSFLRGKLSEHSYYNDAGVIRKKSTSDLAYFVSDSARSLNLVANKYECSGPSFLTYHGSAYKNYTYRKYTNNQNIIDYDDFQNSLSNNVFVDFNAFGQIKSERIRVKPDEHKYISYLYVSDFIDEYEYFKFLGEVPNNYIFNMVENGFYDKLVQQITYLYNSAGMRQIEGIIYEYENNDQLDSYLKLSKVYEIKKSTPSSVLNQISIINGEVIIPTNYICRVKTIYDERNNLIQVSKNEQNATSYLYGYNRTLPIAKFENATYEMVKSALQLEGYTIDQLQNLDDASLVSVLNKVRNSSIMKESLITSITYNLIDGITTETNPAGFVLYYNYDNKHRLSCVRNRFGNVLKKWDYFFTND